MSKINDIHSFFWGPKYWFFLHTIAYHYPDYPNDVTKRKYYDLIQNIPLFLPNIDMGNKFGVLLDKYPVSPYLKCRESFITWVHFIHNKINRQLGKCEISLVESIQKYNEQNPDTIEKKKYHDFVSNETKKQLFTAVFVFLCFLFIYTWI